MLLPGAHQQHQKHRQHQQKTQKLAATAALGAKSHGEWYGNGTQDPKRVE